MGKLNWISGMRRVWAALPPGRPPELPTLPQGRHPERLPTRRLPTPGLLLFLWLALRRLLELSHSPELFRSQGPPRRRRERLSWHSGLREGISPEERPARRIR